MQPTFRLGRGLRRRGGRTGGGELDHGFWGALIRARPLECQQPQPPRGGGDTSPPRAASLPRRSSQVYRRRAARSSVQAARVRRLGSASARSGAARPERPRAASAVAAEKRVDGSASAKSASTQAWHARKIACAVSGNERLRARSGGDAVLVPGDRLERLDRGVAIGRAVREAGEGGDPDEDIGLWPARQARRGHHPRRGDSGRRRSRGRRSRCEAFPIVRARSAVASASISASRFGPRRTAPAASIAPGPPPCARRTRSSLRPPTPQIAGLAQAIRN